MQQIKKFARYLLSLFYIKRIYTYKHLSDFPIKPNKGIVYLLGDIEKEWLAGFVCPCGCGEFIELVLLKDQRPNWHVEKTPDKKVTIRPSIYKKSGCCSHFFLTKGNVEWCKN
jgi:hypothetical protein